jgi:hypothetical protein
VHLQPWKPLCLYGARPDSDRDGLCLLSSRHWEKWGVASEVGVQKEACVKQCTRKVAARGDGTQWKSTRTDQSFALMFFRTII